MVLTLDIGGTYTKYAIIDNGKTTCKGKWETVADFQLLLEKIQDVIPKTVEYIGISSGGFWNENGKSIGYETVESTSENHLTKVLSEKYNCPVYIENDARCALLSEKEYGILKNSKNAVLFVLGSSLGCGVLINGKLFSGSTNQGGAMFMMPEIFDGTSYSYDEHANSIKITKAYDRTLSRGNMLLIEKKALQNDEKALKLIEAYTKAVALKCWYAYLMYDPEMIVLGGGISNSEYIVGKIKSYLDIFFEHDKSKRKPCIVKAQFGEDSNLYGAYLLGGKNSVCR
ncbi:MAG: ROK family protein [Acutalibacteraceae bacterium]